MRRNPIQFLPDHDLILLQDGEQFFPDVLEQIRAAKYEIFIETFILADDEVGRELSEALRAAATRGVRVCITVDSFGSWYLPQDYIRKLNEAGVIFQIYDPQPDWIKLRPKIFRRLHRKLVTIDKHFGYIGGINFSRDHLVRSDSQSKLDYAVRIEGPVVNAMRELCFHYAPIETSPGLESSQAAIASRRKGGARVAFVTRDNFKNRSSIEAAYIAAIKEAKQQIYIANAYFFPGYRLIRALRLAIKRGVEVKIIMQGIPDVSYAANATRSLYSTLTHLGIKLYEYAERPLHAKIAFIDSEWATIGSSNLDPLSLSLNLEANVFVADREFNKKISKSINSILQNSNEVEVSNRKKWPMLHLIKDNLVYHILRWWPQLVDWIPNPVPKIQRTRKNKNQQIEGSILAVNPGEVAIRTQEVKKHKV